MRRLSSLGSRSFRRNFGRFLLTVGGIALGVALFFGVTVANRSVDRQLDRDAASLPTGVVIEPAGSYGGDVPASVLDHVARLPGVATAHGYLGFRAPVGGDKDDEFIYVTGNVERKGSARLPPPPSNAPEPLELDGRKTPGPNEIVIGGPVARRLDARVDGRVTLRTPTGPHELTVVGLYRPRDEGDSGGWGEVTLDTARRLTGKTDVFSYMPVTLGRGVDPGEWLADHADALGPAVTARRSGIGGEEYRELVRMTQATFSSLAAVAMGVGAFLVFLTLSTAVAERSRLYGTMRAIGASRRQVIGVVLREAFALGALATLVGIAVGYGTAHLFLRLAVEVYGIGRKPPVVVEPWAIPAAFVVGVLVTVASALAPAIRASRLSPVEAIRGRTAEDQRLSRAWIAGVVLVAAAAPLAETRNRSLGVASALCLLLGTILLVPLVSAPVARLIGRLTRRLAPTVGDVGVMHMIKERSRSAYTLALVMVVLSTLLALGGVQLSMRDARDRAIDRIFPADLAVYAGQRIDVQFEDAVRDIDGVRGLTEIRFGFSEVVGTGAARVELIIIDPATYFDVQPMIWVDGSDDRARAALARGDAVLLPEGLARRFGARLGESMVMETSEGRRQFSVAGVYPTVETPKRVIVGVGDGRRYFNAGDPNGLAVKTDAGARPEEVATSIRNRLRDRGAIVFLTSEQKQDMREESDRYFNLLYGVLGVAAAMGLLGLANTLAMSVLRRTREIGVLRAIGTHRRQVRSLVLVESATMVAVALALALPLGWLLSIALLSNVTEVLGIVVRPRTPWLMVPVLTVIAAVVAVLAALAPARRAARVQPTVALRFD